MSWGKDIELLDKMHRYLVETNAKGGVCFPSHTPRFHSVHCCGVSRAGGDVESTGSMSIMYLTLYGRQAGRNSSVACILSQVCPLIRGG